MDGDWRVRQTGAGTSGAELTTGLTARQRRQALMTRVEVGQPDSSLDTGKERSRVAGLARKWYVLSDAYRLEEFCDCCTVITSRHGKTPVSTTT